MFDNLFSCLCILKYRDRFKHFILFNITSNKCIKYGCENYLVNPYKINIQEIINNANYVYKGNSQNVNILFDWLDLFERLSHLDCPFEEIFYLNDVDFRLEKTKLFGTNTSLNLFNNCVEYYGKGNFPLMEHLLLYTFIQIRINDIEVPENFYRLVRNLLANTSDNQFRFENDDFDTN